MNHLDGLAERAAPGRNRTLRIFSFIAVMEAFSWAGLLFGMYLKYVTHTTELGVRVFGSLHGAIFVCYISVVLLAIVRRRWPVRWIGALALAASIPPFMTVAFDIWARRSGRLDDPSRELPREARP